MYERLRTTALEAELAHVAELTGHFSSVEEADQPSVLARHVAAAVERALLATPAEADRVRLVNALLDRLDQHDQGLAEAVEQLTLLTRPLAPGVRQLIRPVTPLSSAALLTNARNEPSLSGALKSELGSVDHVDLLCAFVKWHGVRILGDQLAQLAERGIPFRVITTTYMGATEQRALDELVRRYGAQVRVNYASASTRLHAKAWLLRRNTGYDTAFVGSSNLSRSALVDGLEWNVRLSAVATGHLIDKFAATFDSYWDDPAFVPYDPEDPEDVDRLAKALGRNRNDTTPLAGLEVRPYPHQAQILEALSTERDVHDRHRNLVVAATGTGKTVVAALDHARLRGRLLFVAHRKEILQQSRRTYRAVLGDGAFGELYVDGERPERWQHVFASVQSLTAYGVENIPASHFDVVVVDEFHHAEAATYRRLLAHLRPRELLGLTATPERTDGTDVRDFFGGRSAFELRLWDALDADLLVPFHYFGIADDVDLSGVEWKRGSYDIAALEKVYTGNEARARTVVAQSRDKVTDVHAMRALGFCVSVAHAEYMAAYFTQAGIPSLAVSGATPRPMREEALRRLRSQEINCLFAVDLFNEGLDIPEIDTVLLLRPTQSAKIFLQQLGRGLRRAPGKAVLTVLDFIGQQRREFRFDQRYRALTGVSRERLVRDVEDGFPYLPAGSALVLDRVARQTVLANVRAQLAVSRKDLVADLRSYGDPSLARYLHDAGRELADVYRKGGSWTGLRRAAGLPAATAGPGEDALLKRLSLLTHIDDPERAAVYTALAEGARYDGLTEREQRLARMLFFLLWPDRGGFASYDAGFTHLQAHPAVCAELRELVALTLDQARHLPRALAGLQHVPLQSHAHYRREEVLAALDWASLRRKAHGHAAGVVWAAEERTDAFFVNLRKTERDFSPTTMYRDYAQTPALFHWESQNATSLASATGQRYVHHGERGTHVALFVRENKNDDIGAAPFLCLGLADHVSHSGERPISFVWKLRREMPGDMFTAASVVAGLS
ncbi:DEAD/DEAH box helicase [Pseudonocardia ailaonensis]|uniref:DEAD/DEAH box helicase n=1 Tax=Pseudonocardia ailaonensis TaxID=367279 RepID=A0ABN2NRV2_9PSEU